jgi:hypothetical protein
MMVIKKLKRNVSKGFVIPVVVVTLFSAAGFAVLYNGVVRSQAKQDALYERDMRSFYIAESGYNWVIAKLNEGSKALEEFKKNPAGKTEFFYNKEGGKGWYEYYTTQKKSKNQTQFNILVRGVYSPTATGRSTNITVYTATVNVANIDGTQVIIKGDARPIDNRTFSYADKTGGTSKSSEKAVDALADVDASAGKYETNNSGINSLAEIDFDANKTGAQNAAKGVLDNYLKLKNLESQINCAQTLLAIQNKNIGEENIDTNADAAAVMSQLDNTQSMDFTKDAASKIKKVISEAPQKAIEKMLKIRFRQKLVEAFSSGMPVAIYPAKRGKSTLDLYKASQVDMKVLLDLWDKMCVTFENETFAAMMKRLKQHDVKIMQNGRWVSLNKFQKVAMLSEALLLKENGRNISNSSGNSNSSVITHNFNGYPDPVPETTNGDYDAPSAEDGPRDPDGDQLKPWIEDDLYVAWCEIHEGSSVDEYNDCIGPDGSLIDPMDELQQACADVYGAEVASASNSLEDPTPVCQNGNKRLALTGFTTGSDGQPEMVFVEQILDPDTGAWIDGDEVSKDDEIIGMADPNTYSNVPPEDTPADEETLWDRTGGKVGETLAQLPEGLKDGAELMADYSAENEMRGDSAGVSTRAEGKVNEADSDLDVDDDDTEMESDGGRGDIEDQSAQTDLSEQIARNMQNAKGDTISRDGEPVGVTDGGGDNAVNYNRQEIMSASISLQNHYRDALQSLGPEANRHHTDIQARQFISTLDRMENSNITEAHKNKIKQAFYNALQSKYAYLDDIKNGYHGGGDPTSEANVEAADRVLQTALTEGLLPIYEEIFPPSTQINPGHSANFTSGGNNANVEERAAEDDTEVSNEITKHYD